jgi:UDP-N-acetylglucosamine 3-dehydrogenase
VGKTLKVGVIGCGAIAEHLHVPDYHYSPDAEIVALCDGNVAQAKKLAEKYAPSAAVYKGYAELLKDPKVEAVSVCLPNVLHGPVTIAALQAGKHVLVEKPMATSSAEAQKMIDAAKKAGVLLAVNQCQRLFPPHIKAKEVLDSGIMGRVLHVTAMFGHSSPRNWSPDGKWFWRKKDARFGAMADLGVHKADLVRFLTGKEVVEVNAFVENVDNPKSDVDDNLVSCVKFKDGAVGTICASWTAYGKGVDYTIFHCEMGTLRVQLWPDKPCVAHLTHPECEIVFDPPAPANDYPGSWGLDAGGHFARACMGLEAPFCTGEEGKRSLDLVLAMEKAALTGKTVKVK